MAFSQVPSTRRGRRVCRDELGPAPGPREQHRTGSQGWGLGGGGEGGEGARCSTRGLVRGGGRTVPARQPWAQTPVSLALPRTRGPSGGPQQSELSRGTYLQPGPRVPLAQARRHSHGPKPKPTRALDGGGGPAHRGSQMPGTGPRPEGSPRRVPENVQPGLSRCLRSGWVTGSPFLPDREAAEAPAEAGEPPDRAGPLSLPLPPPGARFVSCPGVPGQGQPRGLRGGEAGPGPSGPAAGADRWPQEPRRAGPSAT